MSSSKQKWPVKGRYSRCLAECIDTKAKCRHLKKLTCKGTLLQVFIRVYRVEIQFGGMLVFWTQLCELLPLQPSLFSLTLPPPFLVIVQYVQTLNGWAWVGGVLETIFCRSLTLCLWKDSESTKLLDHVKQKPSSWMDLRRINTCRKVPLQVNFF